MPDFISGSVSVFSPSHPGSSEHFPCDLRFNLDYCYSLLSFSLLQPSLYIWLPVLSSQRSTLHMSTHNRPASLPLDTCVSLTASRPVSAALPPHGRGDCLLLGRALNPGAFHLFLPPFPGPSRFPSLPNYPWEQTNCYNIPSLKKSSLGSTCISSCHPMSSLPIKTKLKKK